MTTMQSHISLITTLSQHLAVPTGSTNGLDITKSREFLHHEPLIIFPFPGSLLDAMDLYLHIDSINYSTIEEETKWIESDTVPLYCSC